MFISSLTNDSKALQLKSPSNMISRSQSSLSMISVQSTMKTPKIKDPSAYSQDICLEVTQMSRTKQDLEEKIMNIMQEMKRLKSVSKNFKGKEQELGMLQDLLVKSNEDLSESRGKLERSEIIMSDLMKNLQSSDNEGLAHLFPIISKQLVRLKQKRHSLIIDDLIYKNEFPKSLKSTKHLKLRSPYVSHYNLQILTSPRIKKLASIKIGSSTSKNTPSDNKIAIEDERLQKIFERVTGVLNRISNSKKEKNI